MGIEFSENACGTSDDVFDLAMGDERSGDESQALAHLDANDQGLLATADLDPCGELNGSFGTSAGLDAHDLDVNAHDEERIQISRGGMTAFESAYVRRVAINIFQDYFGSVDASAVGVKFDFSPNTAIVSQDQELHSPVTTDNFLRPNVTLGTAVGGDAYDLSKGPTVEERIRISKCGLAAFKSAYGRVATECVSVVNVSAGGEEYECNRNALEKSDKAFNFAVHTRGPDEQLDANDRHLLTCSASASDADRMLDGVWEKAEGGNALNLLKNPPEEGKIGNDRDSITVLELACDDCDEKSGDGLTDRLDENITRKAMEGKCLSRGLNMPPASTGYQEKSPLRGGIDDRQLGKDTICSMQIRTDARKGGGEDMGELELEGDQAKAGRGTASSPCVASVAQKSPSLSHRFNDQYPNISSKTTGKANAAMGGAPRTCVLPSPSPNILEHASPPTVLLKRVFVPPGSLGLDYKLDPMGGVLVTKVRPESMLHDYDFKPDSIVARDLIRKGDRIVKFGQEVIQTVEDLEERAIFGGELIVERIRDGTASNDEVAEAAAGTILSGASGKGPDALTSFDRVKAAVAASANTDLTSMWSADEAFQDDIAHGDTESESSSKPDDVLEEHLHDKPGAPSHISNEMGHFVATKEFTKKEDAEDQCKLSETGMHPCKTSGEDKEVPAPSAMPAGSLDEQSVRLNFCKVEGCDNFEGKCWKHDKAVKQKHHDEAFLFEELRRIHSNDETQALRAFQEIKKGGIQTHRAGACGANDGLAQAFSLPSPVKVRGHVPDELHGIDANASMVEGNHALDNAKALTCVNKSDNEVQPRRSRRLNTTNNSEANAKSSVEGLSCFESSTIRRVNIKDERAAAVANGKGLSQGLKRRHDDGRQRRKMRQSMREKIKNGAADDNEDECYACRKGGELLMCDFCPKSFHLGCHIPKLNSAPKVKNWRCCECTAPLLKEKQPCGECVECTRADCGNCQCCLGKRAYRGGRSSGRPCIYKQCENMRYAAPEQMLIDDNASRESASVSAQKVQKKSKDVGGLTKRVNDGHQKANQSKTPMQVSHDARLGVMPPIQNDGLSRALPLPSPDQEPDKGRVCLPDKLCGIDAKANMVEGNDAINNTKAPTCVNKSHNEVQPRRSRRLITTNYGKASTTSSAERSSCLPGSSPSKESSTPSHKIIRDARAAAVANSKGLSQGLKRRHDDERQLRETRKTRKKIRSGADDDIDSASTEEVQKKSKDDGAVIGRVNDGRQKANQSKTPMIMSDRTMNARPKNDTSKDSRGSILVAGGNKNNRVSQMSSGDERCKILAPDLLCPQQFAPRSRHGLGGRQCLGQTGRQWGQHQSVSIIGHARRPVEDSPRACGQVQVVRATLCTLGGDPVPQCLVDPIAGGPSYLRGLLGRRSPDLFGLGSRLPCPAGPSSIRGPRPCQVSGHEESHDVRLGVRRHVPDELRGSDANENMVEGNNALNNAKAPASVNKSHNEVQPRRSRRLNTTNNDRASTTSFDERSSCVESSSLRRVCIKDARAVAVANGKGLSQGLRPKRRHDDGRQRRETRKSPRKKIWNGAVDANAASGKIELKCNASRCSPALAPKVVRKKSMDGSAITTMAKVKTRKVPTGAAKRKLQHMQIEPDARKRQKKSHLASRTSDGQKSIPEPATDADGGKATRRVYGRVRVAKSKKLHHTQTSVEPVGRANATPPGPGWVPQMAEESGRICCHWVSPARKIPFRRFGPASEFEELRKKFAGDENLAWYEYRQMKKGEDVKVVNPGQYDSVPEKEQPGTSNGKRAKNAYDGKSTQRKRRVRGDKARKQHQTNNSVGLVGKANSTRKNSPSARAKVRNNDRLSELSSGWRAQKFPNGSSELTQYFTPKLGVRFRTFAKAIEFDSMLVKLLGNETYAVDSYIRVNGKDKFLKAVGCLGGYSDRWKAGEWSSATGKKKGKKPVSKEKKRQKTTHRHAREPNRQTKRNQSTQNAFHNNSLSLNLPIKSSPQPTTDDGLNCNGIEIIRPKPSVKKSFWNEFFPNRVLPVKSSLSDPRPPKRTIRLNGSRFTLASSKVDKNKQGGPNSFGNDKKIDQIYIRHNCLQKELEKICGFNRLKPEKAVARLEHLQSEAKYIWGIDVSNIEKIKDEGHEGCGFFPEGFFDKFKRSSKYDAMQVRIVGPNLGLAKGMLLKKQGITRIQLPESMIKAPPSDSSDESWVAVVVKNMYPSESNSLFRRFLDPEEDAPPKWIEEKKKPLSDMYRRMLRGYGVKKAGVKTYGERSQYADKLRHAHLRGCTDPTGKLPKNKVFITGYVSGSHKQRELFGKVHKRVFISRSPSMQPDDAKLISVIGNKPKNMSVEEWNFLGRYDFGTVIFPRQEHSLPSLIAGTYETVADYFVLWDDKILDHLCHSKDELTSKSRRLHLCNFKPPRALEHSVKKGSKFLRNSDTEWLSKAQYEMIDFQTQNIANQIVGKLFNLCKKKDDIFDKDAIAYAW
ncbi:hypothetical protein ACHAWF_015675 [Thalassiosira exigua]